MPQMKRFFSFPLLLSVLVLFLTTGCESNETTRGQGYAGHIANDDPGAKRLVIYQLLTRLFSNPETTNKVYGTLAENGVGKFNGITEPALVSLRKLGVTHLWLTGVLEHATMSEFPGVPADDADAIKGRAGSPYAIKDYYDVAPSLAVDPDNRMAEFTHLLQRIHATGMKAIIDFIPNHVARGYHSDQLPEGTTDLGAEDDPTVTFAPNNNFYYLPEQAFAVPADHNPLTQAKAPGEDGKFDEFPAKVTGNNVFSASPQVWDWFETAKLNYGVEFTDSGEVEHFDPVPATWEKMLAILQYWAEKGVDGFRCDMAEMVPVAFWQWAIARVKEDHPDVIFIAEIYNPARYHDYAGPGGFDYLYDKVGVYDRVRELMSGRGDAGRMAEALAQSEGIDGQMLRFLENHDEQRIASSEFAGDPWAAIPGMTVSALLGTGPTMIYFGQEVGEPGAGREGFQGDDGRTTIFDYWGVPEHQKWLNNGRFDGGELSPDQHRLRAFYAELLRLSRYHDAFRIGQRIAVPVQHPQVFPFLRHTQNEHVLVIANFAPDTVKTGVRILPEAWQAMDLSAIGPYELIDLLLTEEVVRFEAENALGPNGIRLNLPPQSARVYELEPI